MFIRDVTDDFCNILVLDDYTLLIFMAIWCVPCLIYFIIWDFVFDVYIQSQKSWKYLGFFGHFGSVCMQRGSGGQFLHTGQRSSPPPHPCPVLKPILAVLHKIGWSSQSLNWASPVLTTTKPCGLFQHIAKSSTTYENPEKSGQNKLNDAGAGPPETSHSAL